MHHGVSFNFGSAKVCSHAIFETCFSYDKNIWFYYATIAYHVGLNAVLGLPHPGPTS